MKFVGKTSQAQPGDVLITQYGVGECATAELRRGCLGCTFNDAECDRAGLFAGCLNGIIFRPPSITSEELEHHRSLLALKGELL